ncbi:MAG: hypothetical protein KF699_08655 [Phycisphaeraceae bacterium]|nr:hypothetical protein [Phycisphaeraceae bacterium]
MHGTSTVPHRQTPDRAQVITVPPPVVRHLSEIPAACGRSEEADDRCRVCGRVLVIRIGPPTPAREAEQHAEGRAAA